MDTMVKGLLKSSEVSGEYWGEDVTTAIYMSLVRGSKSGSSGYHHVHVC